MRTAAARSAVVVGGGVGGLATGLALQRSGWDVRVLERASALDGGGAGLVLWPNALRCLRSLDVLGEVRALGTELGESRVVRPDGRVLSRAAVAADDEGGALGVLRPDLVEVLAAALAPGTLELDTEVADPGDLHADLVVGADGLRSVVRTALWPAATPVARGYTVWRAVLPRADRAGHAGGLTETWGRGVRFGVVPVGRDSTYVYAVAASGVRVDQADPMADLRECFRGWQEPIPALLELIDARAVLRHDVHDLHPGATPLHRGRHVLVGDAAHAMEPNLGQGACLALEDAVVLAHTLSAADAVRTGLEAYAVARRPRVAALARRSRQVGRMAGVAHPGGTWLRDAAMWLTPSWSAALALRGAAGWTPPTGGPAGPRTALSRRGRPPGRRWPAPRARRRGRAR